MCIQGLQQSANGSLSKIIKKMFTVISHPAKETHQPDQCRKCAVVGNSGNLLEFKYGAMIDSHSIVFRYAPSYCVTIYIFILVLIY